MEQGASAGRSHNLDLRSREAVALRTSMSDARCTFEQARAEYESALSTSASLAGLKRLGQEYAQALTRYAASVMDW